MDAETHDWRLYALESHCVDCELKLRDYIANLEAEVARKSERIEWLEAALADGEDDHERAEAAEQRAERVGEVLEHHDECLKCFCGHEEGAALEATQTVTALEKENEQLAEEKRGHGFWTRDAVIRVEMEETQ